MPPLPRFSIGSRFRSVRHAARGIRLMVIGEHNARVHAGASLAVLIVGALLHLSRFEWCVLILATMAVWTAEALNTAFEFLCDVASPDFHPQVARAKDVAAGGVLLSAAGAAVVGLLIFIPHLRALR
jgi:diacylglycerol kinase (ATP)